MAERGELEAAKLVQERINGVFMADSRSPLSEQDFYHGIRGNINCRGALTKIRDRLMLIQALGYSITHPLRELHIKAMAKARVQMGAAIKHQTRSIRMVNSGYDAEGRWSWDNMRPHEYRGPHIVFRAMRRRKLQKETGAEAQAAAHARKAAAAAAVPEGANAAAV